MGDKNEQSRRPRNLPLPMVVPGPQGLFVVKPYPFYMEFLEHTQPIPITPYTAVLTSYCCVRVIGGLDASIRE